MSSGKTSTFTRIGHRGAAALEPANTIRSYERALAIGVDMIEIDVHQTRDGALALAHDRDVKDVNTGKRLVVAECTLAELRALDVGQGERVPTLAECIECVRGRAGLMADMKAFGFEEAVVACLRNGGLKDVIISGCPPAVRARYRSLAPEFPISTTLDLSAGPVDDPTFCHRLDTPYVTPHQGLVTRPFLDALHDLGIKALVWTVDDLQLMRGLLAQGADGIISNRPDLFAQVAL